MGRTNSQLSGGDITKENLMYSNNRFEVSGLADVPETLEVTLPYAQTSLYGMVTNASSTLKNLIINASNTITSLERFMFRKTTLETITMNFDTSSVTNWTYFCDGMSSLTGIYGEPIDLSSATTNFGISALNCTYFRFVPNTIEVQCSLNGVKNSPTVESWASFFAGLKTISSTKTLNLPNLAKTAGSITQTQIDEATAKGWTLSFLN